MIKKEVVFNHCYFIKSCFYEMSLNVTVEEPVHSNTPGLFLCQVASFHVTLTN